MAQPQSKVNRTIAGFHGRHPFGLTGGRQGLLPALLDLLLLWQTRASQRTHLAELDDRLLADMALTREQARAEAVKTFWRA